MRNHGMLPILAAAAMLGTGYPIREYPNRRARREPTLDEVEDMWVRGQMLMLRRERRAAASVIAEIAKATGPWAHRFGYGPHPQTREIARRLRQQARRAKR